LEPQNLNICLAIDSFRQQSTSFVSLTTKVEEQRAELYHHFRIAHKITTKKSTKQNIISPIFQLQIQISSAKIIKGKERRVS